MTPAAPGVVLGHATPGTPATVIGHATVRVGHQIDQHALAEEEDGEGLEPTHTVVSALTNFGVQGSDIKKLKEAGISTAEGVLRLTKRKLEAIKGISTAKAVLLGKTCPCCPRERARRRPAGAQARRARTGEDA